MKLYNFEDLLDEDYSIAWRDPCALSAKRNVKRGELTSQKSADYIIEMGPGAGEKGGKVIFTGTPQQMMQSKDSVTAKYL